MSVEIGHPEVRHEQLRERAVRIAEVGYPYDRKRKYHIRWCNLCAGSIFQQIAWRDRYGFDCRLTKCNCGLYQINPRMSAEDYAEFYRNWYRKLTEAFTGTQIKDQETTLAHIGPQLTELQGRPSGRLLDVGGDSGIKARMLRDMWRLDPLVLDPAKDQVEACRKQGIEAVQGTIEQYNTDERFDLVTSFASFEHFLDPMFALRRMGDLLKDDGLLIFDIIDATVRIRRFGLAIMHKIDHPYWFGHGVMCEYLRRANLRIKRHFWFSGDHILYICERSR